MNDDLNALAKIVDSTKDLQTTMETDKALSLLPRTVKNLLSGLEIWNLQREYKVKEIAIILNKKLEGFSHNQIIDPPMHIAVPALHALSYSMDSSELKEMYANLLSKAMNANYTQNVHPSFIEIIKQFDPYDAILLKLICRRKKNPIVDIRAKMKTGGYNTLEHKIMHFEAPSFSTEKTPSAVTNLQRLGLIDIPLYAYYVDSKVYSCFESDIKIHEQNEHIIKDDQILSIEMDRGIVNVTPLGEKFVFVCID